MQVRSGIDLDVTPLTRATGFRSSDPDETRSRVAKIFSSHTLTSQSDAFQAGMHWAGLGGLVLSVLEYGGAVEVDPGSLQRFLLVQMPLSGAAHVLHHGGELTLSHDTAGIMTPTMPFRIRWEQDCRQLLLKVRREKLEQVCQAQIGHGLRKPVDFQIDMNLATASAQAWRQLVGYALNSIALCNSDAVNPLLAAQLEDLIVTHLLMHQPSNYQDEIWSGNRQFAAPRCVKRAEAFMDSHVQAPISLSDIATEAGVSIRTLTHSFKTFRNTSPMVALRDRRLEGARTDLLARSAGDSVTDIAYRWGFTHLGRFSSLYFSRYGERPLATLRG